MKPGIRLESPARAANTLDERMIPLINVIFLLLLFFLLAGSLTELEREGVRPPRSDTAAIASGIEGDWLLRADGVLMLEQQSLPVEQLETWLSESKISLPHTLRLRADSRVEASRLLPLMRLLQDRGVRQLSLLTISEHSASEHSAN